jgi:type II secretory pathway component PulC
MLGLQVLSLAAGSYLFTPTAVYTPGYTAQAMAVPSMPVPQPVVVRAQQHATSWAVPVLVGSAVAGFALSTVNRRGEASMSVTRRGMLQSAAAAAAAVPLAAYADGATSKAQTERSRAIYGSRVFRLAKADAETVLEEQNAIQLFITGSYRSSADSATKKKLVALQKDIVKAAKAGDTAGAQAGLKSFIALAEIRELDTVAGGNFNPKQRRNAGAPATSDIEGLMGPAAYALYQPLKPK